MGHDENQGHGGHENGGHGHGGHGKPQKPYRIFVDHKPHDWPKPVITGAQIKDLAKVDQQTYQAWQDVPGPEDKLVGDAEEVDLTSKGPEKFFTIKKTTTEG